MYYDLERLDQPVQTLLIVYINAQLFRPIVINTTFCGAQVIVNNSAICYRRDFVVLRSYLTIYLYLTGMTFLSFN